MPKEETERNVVRLTSREPFVSKTGKSTGSSRGLGSGRLISSPLSEIGCTPELGHLT